MNNKPFISLASLLALAAFAVMPVAAQASITSPHYYAGLGAATLMAEGDRIGVSGRGTLSLTNTGSGGGTVTCEAIVGGWAENPNSTNSETGHKGPPGEGETQVFDLINCELAACTAAATGGLPATYVSVLAEPTPFVSPTSPGGNATNLGWKSILFDDTTGTGTVKHEIRSRTVGARVTIECHVQTETTAGGQPIFGILTFQRYEGKQTPWTGPVRASVVPAENFTEFDNKSAANGIGSGELESPPFENPPYFGKIDGALEVTQTSGPFVVNTKNG